MSYSPSPPPPLCCRRGVYSQVSSESLEITTRKYIYIYVLKAYQEPTILDVNGKRRDAIIITRDTLGGQL